MNPIQKILIFGIAGEYGLFWEYFFNMLGYRVLGIEKEDNLEKRKQELFWADVVVFSVTSSATVKVIEEVLPFAQKEQLWINTASVQTPGIEVLKRSVAHYASFHVLGSVPNAETLKDRKIAICSEEGLGNHREWFHSMLRRTEACLVREDPEVHDRYYAVVTLLNRLALLNEAIAIASFGLDPEKFLTLGTTLFEDQFGTIARFLLQNDELDVSLLGSSEAQVPMEHLLQASHHLQCTLVDGGGDKIKKTKEYLRNYFREDLLRQVVHKKYGDNG